MVVIADSSPLRYLIIIEQIHLLPLLYGHIVIPSGVMDELTKPSTPRAARVWMEELPEWITVRSPDKQLLNLAPVLGLGEREAIALVEELAADVLLADDEAARHEAQRRGIPVQGTLGILDLAAEHDLLSDLPEALGRLQSTNFRASKRLLDFFLKRDIQRKVR